MPTTQPARPQVYADGTHDRNPVLANYRRIVVEQYNVHRRAGYDHESTRAMIRHNYGTAGHMLIGEVLVGY